MTRVPSGENATDQTGEECPCGRGMLICAFGLASHIRTMLSELPEAMWVPSGDIATDKVQADGPCRSSPISMPDMVSQIRIVLSAEPEMMRAPSGEKVTD